MIDLILLLPEDTTKLENLPEELHFGETPWVIGTKTVDGLRPATFILDSSFRMFLTLLTAESPYFTVLAARSSYKTVPVLDGEGDIIDYDHEYYVTPAKGSYIKYQQDEHPPALIGKDGKPEEQPTVAPTVERVMGVFSGHNPWKFAK